MTDEELLAYRLTADHVIQPSQILPHVGIVDSNQRRDVYGRLNIRQYRVRTRSSLYILGYEVFLDKDAEITLIQTYNKREEGYVITNIEFSWNAN